MSTNLFTPPTTKIKRLPSFDMESKDCEIKALQCMCVYYSCKATTVMSMIMEKVGAARNEKKEEPLIWKTFM